MNTTTGERVLKSEPVGLSTHVGPFGQTIVGHHCGQLLTHAWPCGQTLSPVSPSTGDTRLTLRSGSISSRHVSNRRRLTLRSSSVSSRLVVILRRTPPCGRQHLRKTLSSIIDARTTLRWAASPLDTVVNSQAPSLAVRRMSGQQPWPVRQACRDRQLDGSCQQPWGLLTTTRMVRSTLHCP